MQMDTLDGELKLVITSQRKGQRGRLGKPVYTVVEGEPSPDLVRQDLTETSHMVCDGGRPCQRWWVPFNSLAAHLLTNAFTSIQREISHLCRNLPPPLFPCVATKIRSHPSGSSQRNSFASKTSPTAESGSAPQDSVTPSPKELNAVLHYSTPDVSDLPGPSLSIAATAASKDKFHHSPSTTVPNALYSDSDYSPLVLSFPPAIGPSDYRNATASDLSINSMAAVNPRSWNEFHAHFVAKGPLRGNEDDTEFGKLS